MQDQKAICFSVMNTECLLNKYLTSYPPANLTGNDFAVTVNLVPVAVTIRYSSARTFSVFRKVDICINFSDRQSLRDSSVIFQLDQDNVQFNLHTLIQFSSSLYQYKFKSLSDDVA